jgi:hypothetical protein
MTDVMDKTCERCSDPLPIGAHVNATYCETCKMVERHHAVQRAQKRAALKSKEDYCSESGALRLKHRIETYWADRGYPVQVNLKRVEFHPLMRSARFDIRSNMKNGVPVGGRQTRPQA